MSAPLAPQAKTGHDELGRTLLSFGQFRKQWELFHGFARFLILGPGLLLFWFAADLAIGLNPWILLASFILIAALSMWAMAWWVIKPQLRAIDVEHEAIVIEALHGKLDNQIIGSLQLGREVAAAGP